MKDTVYVPPTKLTVEGFACEVSYDADTGKWLCGLVDYPVAEYGATEDEAIANAVTLGKKQAAGDTTA